MFYANGSTYEGQWSEDKRHGTGMLRLGKAQEHVARPLSPGLMILANDNRYEGEWDDDRKHGRGKFFYVNRGQVMEGLWVDDICKTGEMKDFSRDQAILPTPYPIPDVSLSVSEPISNLFPFQLALVHPEQVLSQSIAIFTSVDG